MEFRRCYGCMKPTEQDICPHCGCPKTYHNNPNQLPVGTILRGQYVVGKVLGHGGFGITYIGWDLFLEIPVAIKEFYPTHTVNRDTTQSLSVKVNTSAMVQRFEETRERFLREAKTLAKLRSIPQIVGIRGFFTENNTAYIIMEYVQGQNLRHFVQQRNGNVSAKELLPLLEPVVHALAAVHREGLMHRDISPDNIMLLPDGKVVLLDFGAAHDLEKSDADVDLSHSTEAILKHGFAPMEQYRSRGNLGPWTDEYGFCASVYYCLTGKLPPDAPTRAIDDVHPDWSSIPGLTSNQRAALERGMEMRAKDRFGSMEALHEALYKNAPAEGGAKKKKRGWVIPLVLVLLLAAAAAGSVWYWGMDTCTQALLSVFPGAPMSQETEPTEPPTETTVPTEPTIETVPPTVPLVVSAPEATAAPTEETAPPQTDYTKEPWYSAVMVKNPFDLLKVTKVSVTSVTFLDSLDNLPWKAVDLSQAKDGTVMGWIEWNGSCSVFIASEHGINARDCSERLFEGCNNLQRISFGDLFHTDLAKSTAFMFSGCTNLRSADFSKFNTVNVRDMQGMFAGCKSLTSLNIGDWNVSNAENMSELFADCTSITRLPVSNWDVSGVTDMSSMFRGCDTLYSLEIGNWDVSQVTNLSSAFAYCDSLQDLDIGGWDVSNCEDMSYLFAYCSNLVKLPIDGWNVSGVTDMNTMFRSCSALRQLNLNGWDVSSVTDMSWMFHDCSALQTLEASSWDVSKVTDMSHMFTGCKRLTLPDLTGWDVGKVRKHEQFVESNVSINGKFWTFFFKQ